MGFDRYRQNIEVELINFINSDQFVNFQKIMESLTISKVIELQKEIKPEEIVIAQKMLNVYSSLPDLMKLLAEEAVNKKRLDLEKQTDNL